MEIRTIVSGLFGFLVCVHSINALTCPTGYSKYNDRCYGLHTGPATWSQAEVACQAITDGHLAAVTGSALQSVVRNLLLAEGVSDAWLGIQLETHAPSRRLWRYVSDQGAIVAQGCFFSSTMGATAYTYPSNSDTALANDADANIANCTKACRDAGHDFTELYNGRRCRCGAELASSAFTEYDGTVNQDQNDGCLATCRGDSGDYCGGSTRFNSYFYTRGSGWGRWARNQPNNQHGYQPCAAMDLFNRGYLNDLECSDKNRFICKLTPGSSCTGITIGAECYYVSGNYISWFQARQTCKEKNGDLVKFETEAEWAAMKLYLNSITRNEMFWTGLTSHVWRWSTGEELLYDNWYASAPAGQEKPEPQEAGKDCGLMNSVNAYSWEDADCSAGHAYVCQIDSADITTNAVTSADITTNAVTSADITTNAVTTADPNFSTETTTLTTTSTTPPPTTTPTTTPTTVASTTTTTGQVPTTTPTTTTSTTTTTAPTTTRTTTPAPSTTTTPGNPASSSSATSPATTTTTTTTAPATTTTTAPPGSGSSSATTVGSGRVSSTTPSGVGVGTSVVGPTAGRASETTSGLTVAEIILIVICVILLLIIIAMIIFIIVYKRHNAKKNKIHADTYAETEATGKNRISQVEYSHDGRPLATTPYSGSLNDEIYIASDSGSVGSKTGLIKKGGKKTKNDNHFESGKKITMDDKY